jgi:hypothetical protein
MVAVLHAQPTLTLSESLEDVTLHPITVLASYEGQKLPVISASGKKAEVLVREKRQKLNKQTAYSFARAPRFAPGSVEISVQGKQHRIVSYRDLDTGVNLGIAGSDNSYRLVLTAASDYKDCFIAVVFFDPSYFGERMAEYRSTVLFQGLGDLKAGRAREVVIDLKGISFYDMVRLSGMPILFSRGQEVHSNYSQLSSVFFRELEKSQHEKLLLLYRTSNAGKDHELVPYIRFAPVFLDGETPPAPIPEQARVRIAISVKGTVDRIELIGTKEDATSHKWLRAIREWLFFPVLRAGVPEPAIVEVPLKQIAELVH